MLFRLTETMVEAVVEELRRPYQGRWSNADGGGKIRELEAAFCAYQDVSHALAVSSGTAALDAAIFAAGIEPGDEVITSPLAPSYALTPILHFHGRPVFVDIDEVSLNLAPEALEAAITPRTKAILVVHLNGYPADMESILAIARRHSLRVIEDCAHAQGATREGRLCGSFGSDISCFSIQSVKNLPGGEGGVVVTDSLDYYERALLCGQHPARLNKELTDPERRRYISTGGLGYNQRMHPVAAVLALAGMDQLDEWISLRQASAHYLNEALGALPGLHPTFVPDDIGHAYYFHTVAYDAQALGGLPMQRFCDALCAEGVASGLLGEAAYNAPLFQGAEAFGRGCPLDCPHAEGTLDNSPRRFPRTERALATQFCYGFCGFPFEDTNLLDEYIEAFSKVTSNADQLLAVALQP